jgi:hypothetical protein
VILLKKRKNNDIRKYAIFPIIFILLIIGYFIYNKYTENYNYLKKDKSQYLVYTIAKRQSGSYNQYKPYINLKGRIGEIVNNDIDEYLKNFAKENICITYEYDLSGKVLSLILKVQDYSYAESASILNFRTYNINLDTLEILSKEQLLSYYELTNEDLEVRLNEQIHNYYNELELNKCDYNCFLKSRNITEDLEDAEYFVRDSKLVIFKPYISMNDTEIKDFVIN